MSSLHAKMKRGESREQRERVNNGSIAGGTFYMLLLLNLARLAFTHHRTTSRRSHTHHSRQEFLESTFPATTQVVPASAADEDDEPALERHKAAGTVPAEPKLNVANTLAKTLLDQTVGAGFNTLAFGVVLGGLQAAMAHHAPQPGPLFFLAPDAVRYGAVDWAAVLGRCRAEFWSLIRAGWVFWPFVSVVNFAFVKGVQARNLVGSLAGVAWGVYISLVTAAAE